MFPSFTNLQHDLSTPPHRTGFDSKLSLDSLQAHSAASGKVRTEKVVAPTPYAGAKRKKGQKGLGPSRHSSCEQCRAKKTKCDKKEHCSSCQIRGEVCTWSGAFPSVPADLDNPAEASFRAQAEIARLRTIIHHLANRLGVDPDDPLSSPSSPPSPASLATDLRLSPPTEISYARCSSPEPPYHHSIDSTPRHSIDSSASSYDDPLSTFSFVTERSGAGQGGYYDAPLSFGAERGGAGQGGYWEVPRSVDWRGYEGGLWAP